MIWLAALSGCQPPEAPAAPTAWQYTGAPAEALPLLSLAEVAAEVAAVPALLAWINPHHIVNAAHDFQGRMTPDCPSFSLHNDQTLLEGDCATPEGNSYYGYQLSAEAQDVELAFEEVSGYHRVFRWMTGAARYEMADGSAMELLGDNEIRDYDRVEEDGSVVPVVSLYLWGDFRRIAAAGQEPSPSWLEEGIGVQLYLESERYAAGRRVVWEGGVIRLEGPVAAVALRGLTLDARACGGEPEGRISLWQQADGLARWYDVDFGAASGPEPSDACDGCGRVSVEGVDIGEVCAPLGALAEWEVGPWVP